MKTRSRLPLSLAAVSIAAVSIAASGCGVKKATHNKVLNDLTLSQNKLAESEGNNKKLNTQIKDLETKLADARKKLADTESAKSMSDQDKQKRIAKLLSDMKATASELTALRKQRDAQNKRLSAFRALSNRLRKLVDTGKLKVDFSSGQMVLQLPSGVLFPSARAKLSRKGKTALTEITGILLEFKDRKFMVAGHTDNLPLRSRRFKDNWALSQARALSVVRFMLANGFPAKNLAAAGYAEHRPVAPNDSADNRQKNRRIEIILVPDLSELPNLSGTP